MSQEKHFGSSEDELIPTLGAATDAAPLGRMPTGNRLKRSLKKRGSWLEWLEKKIGQRTFTFCVTDRGKSRAGQ